MSRHPLDCLLTPPAAARAMGQWLTPHVRIVLEDIDPMPLIPWPEPEKKPRAKSAPAEPALF